MTNQSLRERFRLYEKKAESISRAIRDAVDAGKIKLANPEQASLRYRNYVQGLGGVNLTFCVMRSVTHAARVPTAVA